MTTVNNNESTKFAGCYVDESVSEEELVELVGAVEEQPKTYKDAVEYNYNPVSRRYESSAGVILNIDDSQSAVCETVQGLFYVTHVDINGTPHLGGRVSPEPSAPPVDA